MQVFCYKWLCIHISAWLISISCGCFCLFWGLSVRLNEPAGGQRWLLDLRGFGGGVLNMSWRICFPFFSIFLFLLFKLISTWVESCVKFKDPSVLFCLFPTSLNMNGYENSYNISTLYFWFHSSANLSLHPSFLPPTCPSVHLFFHMSVYPAVHFLSIRPFNVHLSTVYPSIIHLYSFIHLAIHPPTVYCLHSGCSNFLL